MGKAQGKLDHTVVTSPNPNLVPLFSNLQSVSFTGGATPIASLFIQTAFQHPTWCAQLQEVDFSLVPYCDMEELVELVKFFNIATGLTSLCIRRTDAGKDTVKPKEQTLAFEKLEPEALPILITLVATDRKSVV